MTIYNRLKTFLNNFRPIPVHAFNERLDTLSCELHKEHIELNNIYQEIQNIKKMIEQQSDRHMSLSNLFNETCTQFDNRLSVLEKSNHLIEESTHDIITEFKNLNESQANEYASLLSTVDLIRRRNIDAARNSAEAVWGCIFNNTISQSLWLKNKSFSPGRWAMGYANLYVIYKILNKIHPLNILELGLGQSTKMITQYVSYFETPSHTVVEHDQHWIEFFRNEVSLSNKTKIVKLDLEMQAYKTAKEVRVYKNFYNTFKDNIYDFICIDAPFGSDMKEYARIDILSILPKCLSETFVLLIDDCDRSGERNMVKEIEDLLTQNEILYKVGRYSGKKDCVVIASDRYNFLTTL